MKKTTLIAFVLMLAVPTIAKRLPAPEIAPVVINGVIYSVPNNNGRKAVVEAWSKDSTMRLWKKTIFSTWINPFLEEDVQWVFIKNLEILDNQLIITDEKDRQYSLDPGTKKVKQLRKDRD